MATITNEYSVPSDIYWVDGDVSESSRSVTTSSRKEVMAGGSSFKMCWTCPHFTYQLQYRTRRRLSPPYATTLGHAAGEEVWEEWGDWQGHDLSDIKSDTEKLSWGNLSVTSASFDFGYDFSQFDRIEYQVRVRAFDEKSFKCSEWGYGELAVTYDPIADVVSAIRQPNGDVLLSIESNWLRGGNRFSLTNLRREDRYARAVDGAVRLTNVEPAFEATVPAAMVGDAKRIYATLRFYTSDNSISNGFARQWFDIGESEPPTSIAEPTVTVEDVEPYVQVSVASTGGAYDAVYVTAAFTDALGRQETIEAEAVESNGLWTAFIEAPPYDVAVKYRVSVVNQEGWTAAEAEHATNSNGRCSWSSGSDMVSLCFDIETAATFSSNTETVATSDGGTAVRFGKGGSKVLSASGNLLRKSTNDGSWKPDLELLRQKKQKWTYRKPGGERHAVAITAISESESNNASVSVSISMTEVS